MLNFIRREPALIVGLVLAALGLLAAFGLTITEEQKAAIVAFIGAVLALLGAGVTRSKVTPYRQRTTRRTVERGASDAWVVVIVGLLVLIVLLLIGDLSRFG